jgi:hypothetical protein
MNRKVEPLSTRNKNMPLSQSRCNSSFSSRKMPLFSSKAIFNVVNFLFSKKIFTQELKEKIKGLQKDVTHRKVQQRKA